MPKQVFFLREVRGCGDGRICERIENFWGMAILLFFFAGGCASGREESGGGDELE